MTPKLHMPTITDHEPARIHRHELACHLNGEGNAEQRARIDAALASDPRVQQWRDDLQAEDRAVLMAVPMHRLVATPTLVDRLRTWWSLGIVRGAMATAGMVAATMIVVPQLSKPDPDGNRAKGSAQLAFAVQTNTGARPGIDGEALQAGDRIQLLLRASEEKRVIVVGIDGRGGVDVYFEAELSQWPRNVLQPLPNSLVLDDAIGEERVVAVFGDRSAEAMRAEVMRAAAAAQHGAALMLPMGMQQQQVRFRKPAPDYIEPLPS
jgi:hypothetical protein